MEDYLERQDPKVRKHIRSSHEEFLAGEHVAAEEVLARLKRQRKRRASRMSRKV